MFKKIIAVVMLVLMIPLSVAGAGLGKIKIKSALGEPLDADIELVENSSDEAAKLTAKVAGPDDYAAAGLSEANIPQGIHVQVIRGADNSRVLHLSSDRPLNEAFIELLIKAESPNSNFLRQYTLLLDPPISRMGDEADRSQGNTTQQVEKKGTSSKVKMSALAAASADGMTNEALPEYVPRKSRKSTKHHGKQEGSPSSNSLSHQPAIPATSATASATNSPATAERYTTQIGDVFGKVAQRYQPQGISLKRVMAAFFAANPDAFVNGDMNQLKAGQTLRIPSQQDMGKSSHDASEQEKPAVKQERAKAPEKITAVSAHDQEIALKPQAAAKFVLKISPGDADPVPGDKQQDSAVAATASDNPALADSTDKSTDSNGAESSANPAITNTPAAGESGDAAQPSAAATSQATQSTPPQPQAATTGVDAPSFLDGLMSNLAWIGLGMLIPLIVILILYLLNKRRTAAMQAWQQNMLEDSEYDDGDFEDRQPTANVAQPLQTASQKPAQVTDEQAIDKQVECDVSNSQMFASAPAAVARVPVLPVNETEAPAEALVAESMQPFFEDAAASSKLPDETPLASKRDESDIHEVDPLVEAEIYMSYGRSEQAEKILQNALIKTPNKHELSLGLLKIYAERVDIQAFERVALEVQASAVFGKHEDMLIWDITKTLGFRIDPSNPLYHSEEATPTAMPEMEHNLFEQHLELPPLDEPEAEPQYPKLDEVKPDEVKADDTKSNILEFTLDDISRPAAGKESGASLDVEQLFHAPSKQK